MRAVLVAVALMATPAYAADLNVKTAGDFVRECVPLMSGWNIYVDDMGDVKPPAKLMACWSLAAKNAANAELSEASPAQFATVWKSCNPNPKEPFAAAARKCG